MYKFEDKHFQDQNMFWSPIAKVRDGLSLSYHNSSVEVMVFISECVC